ncbi:melanoma-associated antigen B16 [Nannospalax galili]|uniref:melanoma-associated antigen B16 n=1 Tax=Nannospalax galili TaxID=1026970 RepID=UPI00111C716C|nr:melanoma-associated antigen B16 [Nannospalax galili]
MSQIQENPEGTAVQGEIFEETQGLEVAQVPKEAEESCSSPHPLVPTSRKGETWKETRDLKDVEEPFSSSNPLLPSNKKADPIDETPSTSWGPESCSASAVAAAASSAEGPSRQQAQVSPFNIVQGIPFNLAPLPIMQCVPDDPISRKVDFMVNYMLYKYQVRELMSMEDMIRTVIREDESHFHEILSLANDRMEMVFGLEVKKVDPINHFYGLFIKLGLTYDGMHHHEYSFPKTGLLILILGVVFMKGNRATEEEIWRVLNPMGIIAGVPHFLFGEPRKLVTEEFVWEQYLECQPVPNSFPVRYEYVWGPRARAETSKMKVLEYVAKIHGVHPSIFQAQYQEALLEEEERTLAMLLDRAASSSMVAESSSAIPSRFPPR